VQDRKEIGDQVTSKELVQKTVLGWSGRLAAHEISYNGDGHVHRAIPYNPTTPAVALQKAQLMQSDGVDICICTWQGPWAESCNAAAIAMLAACEQVGLQFALLLDPGGMQKWLANQSQATITDNVIAALQAVSTVQMIDSPAYVPERWVLDFNTGANLSTLKTALPSLTFLEQGAGFSWISIPAITDSTARNTAAVANLKTQHANPAMKIASFCKSFDDSGQPLPTGVQSQSAFDAAGGVRNLTNSVWSGPARILESFAGQFSLQQLATINPATPVIAILTWSDYDEQSSGPREKVVAEEQGIVWL
jgi:hypothetical protein